MGQSREFINGGGVKNWHLEFVYFFKYECGEVGDCSHFSSLRRMDKLSRRTPSFSIPSGYSLELPHSGISNEGL